VEFRDGALYGRRQLRRLWCSVPQGFPGGGAGGDGSQPVGQGSDSSSSPPSVSPLSRHLPPTADRTEYIESGHFADYVIRIAAPHAVHLRYSLTPKRRLFGAEWLPKMSSNHYKCTPFRAFAPTSDGVHSHLSYCRATPSGVEGEEDAKEHVRRLLPDEALSSPIRM